MLGTCGMRHHTQHRCLIENPLMTPTTARYNWKYPDGLAGCQNHHYAS